MEVRLFTQMTQMIAIAFMKLYVILQLVLIDKLFITVLICAMELWLFMIDAMSIEMLHRCAEEKEKLRSFQLQEFGYIQ